MRSVNFIAQNSLSLLFCGTEFFPALVKSIDEAKIEVFLETYIFAGDPTGNTIKAALISAAQRGVIVHVIADWIGTGNVQAKLLGNDFSQAGVNYRIFNPWFRSGSTRSHRKICVVDGAQAFVGGININDDLFFDDDDRAPLLQPRWDFAVQISGPLVGLIHREAKDQWERLGPLDLVSRIDMYRSSRKKPPNFGALPTLAGLVVRDNLRDRSTIQRAYLQALGNSTKSVLLASPYFAPGRRFMNALAAAAARGVEVTLLIGAGQFRLQDAVARSFYPKLLKSGVKLVEYRKTQLHGKVAVIDDMWATVGSSNCDGLSLFLNQEANIVIKDAEFSRKLRGHIKQGIAEGTVVHANSYSNVSWYQHLWYGTAYLLYSGVMRIITLGRYD